MHIKHTRHANMSATLECSVFGKYGAFVTTRVKHCRWPPYSGHFVTQADAIKYLRLLGYSIPIGF